jgi:tetratricopeptide (TPR) repeat protein
MKKGIFLAYLLSAVVHAAPYVPADGAQVIERLPAQGSVSHQELQRMRSALAASPNNVELATGLARRYIEIGRSTSDPRYFGYAQAALSPWWNQSNAPPAVLILRATLMQSQHQFASALSDLDTILKADPRNAQAWLTRATILQVQGKYEQAKDSCLKLSGMAPELVVATCIAGSASINGQAPRSYALLENTLQRSATSDPGIKVWATTLLAEIAARNGELEAAERHFKTALAIDPSDSYLLGAYADILLDQNRADEVVRLLKDHLRVDSLLLRYALALKQQQSPTLAKHIDTLHSRFNAAVMRGDTVHQREQARFELHLRNNPEAALKIAQENWAVQKEPADARILLESAIANEGDGARAKAEPVLAWLKRTALEDKTLQDLAAKLERAT